MATTTADMQAIQAADQTTDNAPANTAAPEDQSNMTPVVTGTPGLLENTWVVHFQVCEKCWLSQQ